MLFCDVSIYVFTSICLSGFSIIIKIINILDILKYVLYYKYIVELLDVLLRDINDTDTCIYQYHIFTYDLTI